MATLTLVKLWLNRIDTGEAVSANTARSPRGATYDIDGDVHTFGGGRQRAVLAAGLRGQYPVTLRQVSASTVDTLKGWAEAGVTVQIRDHRGNRYHGVLLGLSVRETMQPTLQDVALTVKLVTVAASV